MSTTSNADFWHIALPIIQMSLGKGINGKTYIKVLLGQKGMRISLDTFGDLNILNIYLKHSIHIYNIFIYLYIDRYIDMQVCIHTQSYISTQIYIFRHICKYI